jgi:hypothetical protein
MNIKINEDTKDRRRKKNRQQIQHLDTLDSLWCLDSLKHIMYQTCDSPHRSPSLFSTLVGQGVPSPELNPQKQAIPVMT